jgi:hypothetical protein
MLLLRGEDRRERGRESEGGRGMERRKEVGVGEFEHRDCTSSSSHTQYCPITLVNFDVDSAVFQQLFYICTVGFSE